MKDKSLYCTSHAHVLCSDCVCKCHAYKSPAWGKMGSTWKAPYTQGFAK